MENTNSLVPQNKFDMETAEAAVAAGYPAVTPILPELIKWLKDYNWPVAHVLAPFLASIGSPLISCVQHVMNTDDEIWKYWVMGIIMRESKEVASAFRSELERIAYAPTTREKTEELDEIAQSVLQEHGWH